MKEPHNKKIRQPWSKELIDKMVTPELPEQSAEAIRQAALTLHEDLDNLLYYVDELEMNNAADYQKCLEGLAWLTRNLAAGISRNFACPIPIVKLKAEDAPKLIATLQELRAMASTADLTIPVANPHALVITQFFYQQVSKLSNQLYDHSAGKFKIMPINLIRALEFFRIKIQKEKYWPTSAKD